MINKYRKKPVIIEAIQFFNGDGSNTVRECIDFVGNSVMYDNETHSLIIVTLEGDMYVSDGDFIIKGISGEFYPCKPDIFVLTYEALENEK
jgi:hypothetical protein